MVRELNKEESSDAIQKHQQNPGTSGNQTSKESLVRYPSPERVLFDLASRGPSAVRTEALAMLGQPVPGRWPECPRRTRLALLRQLACNKSKASRARLEALKELLAVSGHPANREAESGAIDQRIAELAAG
jgi:hypothetical protein